MNAATPHSTRSHTRIHLLAHLDHEEDHAEEDDSDPSERPTLPSITVPPPEAEPPTTRNAHHKELKPAVFDTPTADREFFAMDLDAWQTKASFVDAGMMAQQRRDGLARWVVAAIVLCTAITVAAFAH